MTSRVDFVKLALSANHSSLWPLAGEVEHLQPDVHSGEIQ
jgi:hypothetical protein